MSKLGLNVKITVGSTKREALQDVMAAVFGASRAAHGDDLDVYTLADGANLGAYYVADEQALSPQKLRAGGAWLELVVDDLATAKVALAERGIEPFEYADTAHDYVQLPGGQVVRIAEEVAR